MLRFYHTSNTVQRCPQATQRAASDMRALSRAEGATERRIEHPLRDLQWRLRFISSAADQNDRSPTIPLPVNCHFTFVERVPRVNDFRRIGFMCFVSLGCTTEAGRIVPSVQAFPPSFKRVCLLVIALCARFRPRK
jgi:hypothetical protein